MNYKELGRRSRWEYKVEGSYPSPIPKAHGAPGGWLRHSRQFSANHRSSCISARIASFSSEAARTRSEAKRPRFRSELRRIASSRISLVCSFIMIHPGHWEGFGFINLAPCGPRNAPPRYPLPSGYENRNVYKSHRITTPQEGISEVERCNQTQSQTAPSSTGTTYLIFISQVDS